MWRTGVRLKSVKEARESGAQPGSPAGLLGTTRNVPAGESLSGHERDCLFLNRGAQSFADLSGVSGMDDESDGRCAAVWDWDRDGWPDMATTNKNAPLLRIYHNDLGRVLPREEHQSLAVKLVGGNHTAQKAIGRTNRDGYGAKVLVDLGDVRLLREQRAGEGLSSQNSTTLLIGLGRHGVAQKVTVRWPSGKEQVAAAVPAGTLLTVYEDPGQAPGGQAFVRAPYLRKPPAWKGAPPPAWKRDAMTLRVGAKEARGAPLRLYLTMATWCKPCAREIPVLRRIREAIPASELAMLGVPVESADTPTALRAWEAEHGAPYEILDSATAEEVGQVTRAIHKEMYRDSLPGAVITDGTGRVLWVQFGAPTISQLRRWLEKVRP